MRSMLRPAALAFATVLVAAACSSAASPSAAPTAAPTAAPSAAPTAAASAAMSEAPTTAPTVAPTQDACAPANLTLVSPGKLTIGTDNPAYPPYYAIRAGGNTPPWEDLGYTGDPTTGEGFESAVAYAVAQQLGFTKDQVTWVVVPFANAIAPGPKTSDFVINQVSYSADRAKAVDLSDGYYDLNQAVVALKSNPAAKARTVADLKAYKFGAQVGTTSYQAIQDVIAPTQETQVYNDNTGAIQALQSKLVDAIVVDLPTADYITNVQIENGAATIVGQLAPTGGVQEHFSLALGKGSALTPCLNRALTALGTAGTLKALASKWLPFQDGVPVLK